MPPGCASSSCVTTLGGGFSAPQGVALDGSGSIYIADTGNSAVKKMPPGCTASAYNAGTCSITPLGGGFSRSAAVALDGSGNVYVADTGNNAVKEMPPGCASSSCVTTLGGGFNLPQGVAVDDSGNVYVTDPGNDAVREMPPGCASSSCVTTLGGGFSEPYGVAVDGRGNVYVGDSGNNAVSELDRADPPSLAFAATPYGYESSDSPQSVTLENIGNAPLTFPAPTSGNNPSISASFTLDNATTCPQVSASSSEETLDAGANCALAVDFIPQAAGSISGSLVLTDNALNANPATQTIPLSGTGQKNVSQTISFGALPDVTYGAAPIITLTAKASSGLLVSYTVTGPAQVVFGSTLIITGVGQITVTASQSGNQGYGPAPSVTQQFSVGPAPLKVTANDVTRAAGTANPPLTYTITGFVYGETPSVVSGTATLATTATQTSPPGTYPITFSTEGLTAANYGFSYADGTLTVSAAVGAGQPDFTPLTPSRSRRSTALIRAA
jgi:streptogramin lyase